MASQPTIGEGLALTLTGGDINDGLDDALGDALAMSIRSNRDRDSDDVSSRKRRSTARPPVSAQTSLVFSLLFCCYDLSLSLVL